MASLSMMFKLLGKDVSASKALKGVGATATKTGKRFEGLGLAAGVSLAAVGVAALKFGSDSVKAYSEAEEAQKRLAFAFEKFPALADSSQEALQRLNSEWQKKTKFDDDNIASGQAILAQFKVTGKQLETVTPLLLDYASATGKDVPEAAKDLGKALLGNAKALKNIGIKYTATGDSATDFANITELLREKVGGFAEKEGKTAAGQLAILANQFGEVQEAVGGALVPALSSLVDVAIPVVEAVGKIPAPVLASALAITVLGAGAVLVVPKLLAFRASMIEAGVAAKSLAFNLKTVGMAAVSMGAFLVTEIGGAEGRVLKPIKRVTAAVAEQRDRVKDVTAAFDILRGVLDKGAAKDAWISALNGISAAAKEAKGRLLGASGASITLREQVREDVSRLTTYAEGFKNPVKKAKVLEEGLGKIRQGLIRGGVKKADVDKFLSPLVTAASDAYTKSKRVGANIGLGLARGIASERANAIAQAQALGKAAVQAVRRGADVNSPSKYTTWVGSQIASGLVKGVERGTPDAERAIAGMTRGALEAANVSTPTLSMMGGSTGGSRAAAGRVAIGDSRPMVVQLVTPAGKVLAETLVDYRNSIRRPLGLG